MPLNILAWRMHKQAISEQSCMENLERASMFKDLGQYIIIKISKHQMNN